MIIFKIIGIFAIIIFIIGIYCLANISDFGESSMYMTEEEYDEACKAYQKYWDAKEKIMYIRGGNGYPENYNIELAMKCQDIIDSTE